VARKKPPGLTDRAAAIIALSSPIYDYVVMSHAGAIPKSHAATFAVLVYQSAWLKRYHPAALYVALFNNQPMGYWSPSVLAGDARRHGIPILAVDVHRSQARCAVEGVGIRLGLSYIHGLGEAGIARLEAARQSRPFASLADLCRRTRLVRGIVENLVRAGALDG
jgi:error-prone DNA polymerase